MGFRLSKIYTRKGDNGTTGMADGHRVRKDSARVSSLGDVDELNSMIGVLIAHNNHAPLNDIFITIQHDLFNVGGQLAMPEAEMMTEQRVQWLEQQLDQLNETLTPLEEFILPGGGQAATFCHLARAICRRAERSLVSLAGEDDLAEPLMAYMNRLSDYLFVAARILSREAGENEVYWSSERIRNSGQ